MELYKGISQLLGMYGRDYILSSKIVNALIDLNAFEKHRALKNLFKTIHSEGYIERIYNENEWSLKCEQLIHEIEQDFAFPRDLIEYALKSVAFGLGYLVSFEKEQISEDEKSSSMEYTSTSGIPTLSLTQLKDFVYLRQDWYDASPIILQDLKVELKKVDLPISYSSSIPLVYEISFSFDVLPKSNKIGEVVFTLIALDNDNKVLFHKLFFNDMTQRANYKRNKIDFYSYDLSIRINSETFIPYKTRSFSFVKEADHLLIDKLVLCIENGFSTLNYSNTFSGWEKDIKGLHYPLWIRDTNFNPIDLTPVLNVETIYQKTTSYFQAFGNQNKIFFYFEIDNNGNNENEIVDSLSSFEIQIYNNMGNLKQKEIIMLPGLFNKKGLEQHYSISQEFTTLIPVEEISKIYIRKRK